MRQADKSWLTTADARQARLFHVSRTDQGTSYVEQRAEITDDRPGHEHDRPSARTDSRGHRDASAGHESDEEMARSARRVGQWLQVRLDENDIDQVVVF